MPTSLQSSLGLYRPGDFFFVNAANPRFKGTQVSNCNLFLTEYQDVPDNLTLIQRIWKALYQARTQRGISPGFAAKTLGIDASTLFRNEREGVNDLERIGLYANHVLRMRIFIEFPGGKFYLYPIENSVEMPLTSLCG